MKSQRPSPAALPEPRQLPRFPFSLRSQLCFQLVLSPEGWKGRKRSSVGGSAHPWLLLPLQAPHSGSPKVLKALTKLRNSSAELLPQRFLSQQHKRVDEASVALKKQVWECSGAHWGNRICPKRIFPAPPATRKKIPCSARKCSQ